MPADLSTLKRRLGATASGRIGDTDLAGFLADASDRSTDPEVILTLAQAWVYQRLATEAAGNFKYSQADESVDKTAEAAQWRALYEQTWSSLPESIRASADVPDTFELGSRHD